MFEWPQIKLKLELPPMAQDFIDRIGVSPNDFEHTESNELTAVQSLLLLEIATAADGREFPIAS